MTHPITPKQTHTPFYQSGCCLNCLIRFPSHTSIFICAALPGHSGCKWTPENQRIHMFVETSRTSWNPFWIRFHLTWNGFSRILPYCNENVSAEATEMFLIKQLITNVYGFNYFSKGGHSARAGVHDTYIISLKARTSITLKIRWHFIS